MKIEMDKEDVKFLQELASEIKTQDNRATASPYFYVVRDERWRVANPDYSFGGDTKIVYIERITGDNEEFNSVDEYKLWARDEAGYSEDTINDAVENSLEELTIEKYYEEDNMFLTEKAYAEHIRRNGHNLKNPHSYVKHAYRNEELDKLIKIILKFADKEIK